MANVFKPTFPNPITTRGDLIVGASGGVVDRLPSGANGNVLTADSGSSLGLSWSAAAAGNVITNFSSLRVEFASVNSDGTISAASGSFLASVNRVNNTYQLNFGSSMWSAAPVCFAQGIDAATVFYRGASGPTTSGFVISQATSTNGAGTTGPFNVICIGKP